MWRWHSLASFDQPSSAVGNQPWTTTLLTPNPVVNLLQLMTEFFAHKRNWYIFFDWNELHWRGVQKKAQRAADAAAKVRGHRKINSTQWIVPCWTRQADAKLAAKAELKVWHCGVFVGCHHITVGVVETEIQSCRNWRDKRKKRLLNWRELTRKLVTQRQERILSSLCQLEMKLLRGSGHTSRDCQKTGIRGIRASVGRLGRWKKHIFSRASPGADGCHGKSKSQKADEENWGRKR